MAERLDAAAMLGEAERITGLDDWGSDLFREPFEVLIRDLNTEARLHDLGARRAHRRLLDSLTSRLRLNEDRKRFPGIADEEVAAPIFVTGLPRAGTTFFHNLLSADPDNRSPMTWEIMYPSPPPEPATYAEDPRIAEARDAIAFGGFDGAEIQSIHPFDAGRPEECNFMWELSLLTVNYMAWWHVPNYRALLYKIDFRPVYEEQRQLLQHLQHRFRRRRWVLKTPAHMAWLGELFAVFPDAMLVQCHRDPAKIVPSLANNLRVMRRQFSDMVPEGEFGMLQLQADGLARVAAFRARPEYRDRFVDAHYTDVQADPIGALKAAYRHFDLDLDPAREDAVRSWMEDDRDGHAKGPKHAYAMESFGLDYAQIDRVMGEYIRTSQVRLER